METKTIGDGTWVRESRRLRLIPFGSITHVRYHEGLSVVYMGKEILKKLHTPLNGLEQKMPEDLFFRTHRNYIINKAFVSTYEPEGSVSLLSGREIVPVARRRRRSLENFLSS